MADRRRNEPHPARGEVFSTHHQANPPTGPRGNPSWAERLADDAQADAEGQERLNPPDPTPPTPRQTTQWPPR